MSKTVSTKRARRPKNIYAKGWETRRRRAEAAKEARELILSMGATLEKAAAGTKGWKPITMTDTARMEMPSTTAIGASEAPGANQASQDRPSEINGGDALLHMSTLHRDEQLCSFIGTIDFIRKLPGVPTYMPITVSRTSIEAIEDFLRDHGYSAFGKGSGLLMSVSTNPKAA